MKKQEELIHIKFEYEEAVNSKKDVLSLELALLESIKAVRKYQTFRLEELKLRLKLYQKIKALLITLKLLKASLPKLDIPKFLKKEEEIVEEKRKKIKIVQEDLETQLREINQRLKSLEQV